MVGFKTLHLLAHSQSSTLQMVLDVLVALQHCGVWWPSGLNCFARLSRHWIRSGSRLRNTTCNTRAPLHNLWYNVARLHVHNVHRVMWLDCTICFLQIVDPLQVALSAKLCSWSNVDLRGNTSGKHDQNDQSGSLAVVSHFSNYHLRSWRTPLC